MYQLVHEASCTYVKEHSYWNNVTFPFYYDYKPEMQVGELLDFYRDWGTTGFRG